MGDAHQVRQERRFEQGVGAEPRKCESHRFYAHAYIHHTDEVFVGRTWGSRPVTVSETKLLIERLKKDVEFESTNEKIMVVRTNLRKFTQPHVLACADSLRAIACASVFRLSTGSSMDGFPASIQEEQAYSVVRFISIRCRKSRQSE